MKNKNEDELKHEAMYWYQRMVEASDAYEKAAKKSEEAGILMRCALKELDSRGIPFDLPAVSL